MAELDYGFDYGPRIEIGATVFTFTPKDMPIRVTSERFTNNMKLVKVPLRDGVNVSGVSRGSLVVTFSGTISKNTTTGILHTKQLLMNMFLNASGQTFTFYRYYNAAKQNYRWYEDCVCKDLSFDFSDKRKISLPFTFTIVVPSGVESKLITTRNEAPGVGSNHSGIISGGSFLGDDDTDASAADSALPDNLMFLYGPLIIRLTDAAGASSFMIRNSNGDYIFKVDSTGAVQVTAPPEVVASITAPS